MNMTKAAEARSQAVSPLSTALVATSEEAEEDELVISVHKREVEFSTGVHMRECCAWHAPASAARRSRVWAAIMKEDTRERGVNVLLTEQL